MRNIKEKATKHHEQIIMLRVLLDHYEVNKKNPTPPDDKPLDVPIISIPLDTPKYEDISGKKYDSILQYIKKHRIKLQHMINLMRTTNPPIFIDQSIDLSCEFIFQFLPNHYAIKTTGDGNCLFHATSISMFGDESQSYVIKLLATFIITEYEKLFAYILVSTAETFDQ